MSTFDLTDLTRILTACAGTDEPVDLAGADVDTPFVELGYDSLALLELASMVQRDYGVPMPDESIEEMTTPRAAVDYVNGRLAEAAAA